MTLNPRLQPGDVALKSDKRPDGSRRWIAEGRCAACRLEVTPTQPAVVYRPPALVISGALTGLFHWDCAPADALDAAEDVPRVIRFNAPRDSAPSGPAA